MKALDKDGLDYVVDKIYDVINSGGSTDYIVEEVNNGAWIYEKWASGKAIAYTPVPYDMGAIATTGSYGNGYYSERGPYTFPSGLFISAPSVFVQVHGDTGLLTANAHEVTASSYKLYVGNMRNETVQNGRLNIIAYGLWKEFTPSVSHEHATMQTGSGTKTSAVSSFERCYWQKFGNLVFVAFTFTAASSGITVTSQFFTGLPKPVAYFRFSGTLGNTSKACRLSMGADGSISNAYTVVGDIQGGVVDGSVVYFTNE